MHKLQKWLISGSLVIASCSLLLSCGGNAEPEKKEEMKDSVTVNSAHQTAEESDVSYTLPSPMQIASIFQKSGLKYHAGLTNSADNAGKYKAGNNLTKALNLGVYSADLSYCILNKQSQESKNYFKACKDLASELGMSKAFEAKNVAQRINKNLSNPDSLPAILVDVQMESENILSENNQEYISVVSFTGAWIESMYLGIEVHAKEKNPAIATKLVEQMAIAENIIKALKAYSTKDTGIEGLVKQMASLNDIYNGFKSVKEIKATDPDVIDPAKIEISLPELFSFSKRVEEIRSEIIK